MAGKGFDLMSALGPPPGAPLGGKAPMAKPKAAGLLAGKDPKLQAYLRDAVDDSLSPDERAEALCQAIEFTPGDSDESEPDGDDAGPMVTEDDGDY